MYSLLKKMGFSIAMLVYWRVPHTKKKVLLKTGQMAACAVAGASPVHMKIRKPSTMQLSDLKWEVNGPTVKPPAKKKRLYRYIIYIYHYISIKFD